MGHIGSHSDITSDRVEHQEVAVRGLLRATCGQFDETGTRQRAFWSNVGEGCDVVMHEIARGNAAITLLVLLGAGRALWGQAEPALVAGVVIDAGNGSPIRKAYVSLSTAEDNPAEALAITDSSGRFAFANVPSGRYQLHVQRDGYQQAWYGAPTPNHAPGVIALHSGETRQDFVLRMTLLGAISGVVLDQDGDPLDGAMVSLWMPWFQRGKPGFVQRGSTVTNDRGEYRITDEDPLSARAETRWTQLVGRGAWRTRTETRTVMTATKDAFLLHAELDAYEGEKRVLSHNWERVVPRDLL